MSIRTPLLEIRANRWLLDRTEITFRCLNAGHSYRGIDVQEYCERVHGKYDHKKGFRTCHYTQENLPIVQFFKVPNRACLNRNVILNPIKMTAERLGIQLPRDYRGNQNWLNNGTLQRCGISFDDFQKQCVRSLYDIVQPLVDAYRSDLVNYFGVAQPEITVELSEVEFAWDANINLTQKIQLQDVMLHMPHAFPTEYESNRVCVRVPVPMNFYKKTPTIKTGSGKAIASDDRVEIASYMKSEEVHRLEVRVREGRITNFNGRKQIWSDDFTEFEQNLYTVANSLYGILVDPLINEVNDPQQTRLILAQEQPGAGMMRNRLPRHYTARIGIMFNPNAFVGLAEQIKSILPRHVPKRVLDVRAPPQMTIDFGTGPGLRQCASATVS